MESGKLIVWLLANMRRKGRHRARIACFQFGKRLKITLRRGVFVLCIPKGFESTQSLHPTPQNKVPDRSASELFHPRGERCAGAYARAELLVGSFQSRRNVDGVAIGCVVEEAPATKIADERRSGMNAYARDTQRNALFMTACPKRLGVLVKSQCAGNRASGMVCCSPGAPNSKCNASPTIFATVPSWANTISVMPVRYSLNSGPRTLGSSVSTSAVKLAMSVKRVAISRRCPPRSTHQYRWRAVVPDLVKSSATARHRPVRLLPDADARLAIIRCAGWFW